MIHRKDARNRYKAIIVAAMGGACYRCGETRLKRLTLHHRKSEYRTQKNNNPDNPRGTLWYGVPTVETWAEVWLCDLLCYGCHHELHTDSYDSDMSAHDYLAEWESMTWRPEPIPDTKPTTAGLKRYSPEWHRVRKLMARYNRANRD